MPDLLFFPVLSLALVPLAVWWYVWLARVTPLASSHADRLPLYLAPPLCLLLIPACLLRGAWGAEVGWRPVLICSLSGTTCVLLAAAWFFPWLGLSPRDDVAERRNRPAGWAVAGGFVGLALAFGMAAGSPPPGWRLPFPLGLVAMAAVFAVWAGYERLTGASEAITVERDRGAAFRLAALLSMAGLVIGLAFAYLVPLLGLRGAEP